MTIIAAAALAAPLTEAREPRPAFVEAYAILGDRLLIGRADIPPEYHLRARVDLAAPEEPALACRGFYVLRGGSRGELTLDCPEGRRIRTQYTMKTATSGHLPPASKAPDFSFVYGMKPKAAIRYLRAPAGAVLEVDPADGLRLRSMP